MKLNKNFALSELCFLKKHPSRLIFSSMKWLYSVVLALATALSFQMASASGKTLANEKTKSLQTKVSAPPLSEDSIYQMSAHWIDQEGKTFSLSELKGKPVALSMIYMSCTYVCPATVAHMKDLERLLKDKPVQFVLVSFDPERDTPEVMRKYAQKQNLPYPKWRFITSKSESDIRELAALIDFRYKKTEDGDYDHSFGIIALDSEGRIKGTSIGTKMKPSELVPFYE